MKLKDRYLLQQTLLTPDIGHGKAPIVLRIIAIALLVLFSVNAFADECEVWFLKSKVRPGTKNCEIECSIIRVDMGTFTCHDECEKLCSSYFDPDRYDSQVLTPSEVALSAKYPSAASKVWIAQKKALSATEKYFTERAWNNEADAFRHFVWAGEMTRLIGAEKAQAFLDAHENRKNQDPLEKEMDDHNNLRGIRATQRLTSKKSFSSSNLEKEALKELAKGRLKVNAPTGEIPKWKN